MTKGNKIRNLKEKVFRFQKFEVFSCEFKSITKVLPVSRTEIHPIVWQAAEFFLFFFWISSLAARHDFEVLQCIVGGVGSGGFYAWGKAMAHCDWLRGQLDQALAQAAQASLLCGEKGGLRSGRASDGRRQLRLRLRLTLTQVQVADVETLLQGQVAQQGAEVGVGGHVERVAAQLQDLLAGRVAQGVPRAAEAFAFARLGPTPHVLCVRGKVQVRSTNGATSR